MTFETKKEETGKSSKVRDKEVRRAVLLLKRAMESQSTDLTKKVALWKQEKALPDDIRKAAYEIMWKDYSETGIPDRVGRRQDLMKDKDFDKNTIIVKISIAGSGYGKWRTHVSREEGGEDLDWGADLGGASEVTHYERDAGKGSEMMFAGPGGKGTTTAWNKGITDTGSNSIDELVTQVPGLVRQTIEKQRGDNHKRPILILMRAHSRGAVAASQVAAKLRQSYPKAKVELVLIDPVPGPAHELLHGGKDVKIDLEPSALDEFTLVYSIASGYVAGFTPQTVLGAQRIIVSSQNHGAGLDEGFIFRGKRYKGSALNSLEPGVYIDLNSAGQSRKPLQRVADIDEAKTKMKEAYKASEKTGGNRFREGVIKDVLKDFFNKANA